MKRSDRDVVGLPKPQALRHDVAGVTAGSDGCAGEVASFRHALAGPMGSTRELLVLLADFEDFLTGEVQLEDGVLGHPDPFFRERLRKRLWRTHVHTRPPSGRDKH